MFVLEAHNIHKTFNYPVKTSILNGIDFAIKKNEAIAIMGASGEGKTTLLHILSSLERPTSGKIYIKETPLNSLNKAKLRNEMIGFIFQSFHLLEDYSVVENILMPARIARKQILPGSLLYSRAEELLHQIDLYKRKDFSVKLLSGGEKQRVAIARALINDPELIFADEPSGNLDHHTSKEIHQLLLHFAKKRNKSLIIATHDNELANLCDKIYILQNGVLSISPIHS